MSEQISSQEGQIKKDRIRIVGLCWYDGELLDKTPWGEGKAIFDNGNILEGNFKNDVIDSDKPGFISRCANPKTVIYKNFHLRGPGLITYIDPGSEGTEKGEFKDGFLDGEGVKTIYIGVRRRVLSGTFMEGKLCGQGEKVTEFGEVQQGHFVDNLLHGKGKYFASIGVLEGQFKNGVLISGMITTKQGEIFQGTFKNNSQGTAPLLHGKNCVHTSARGERVYRGEYESGLLINGTVEYKQCLITKGDYDENRMLNGECAIEFGSGKVYSGTFVHNFLTFGKVQNPSGEWWEGSFRFNILNGQGRHETKPTEQIVKGNIVQYIELSEQGEFLNGKLSGMGRKVQGDGHFYEGKFVNGELVEGKRGFPSGEIQEGTFVNNVLHGSGVVFFPNKVEQKGHWHMGQMVSGTRQSPTKSFAQISCTHDRRSVMDDFLLHLTMVAECTKFQNGMSVLIISFATTSDKCRDYVPMIEEIIHSHEDIYVVAISLEPLEDVQKYYALQLKGAKINLGVDQTNQFKYYQMTNKMSFVPYMYVFDANGIRVADGVNCVDELKLTKPHGEQNDEEQTQQQAVKLFSQHQLEKEMQVQIKRNEITSSVSQTGSKNASRQGSQLRESVIQVKQAKGKVQDPHLME